MPGLKRGIGNDVSCSLIRKRPSGAAPKGLSIKLEVQLLDLSVGGVCMWGLRMILSLCSYHKKPPQKTWQRCMG